MNERRAHPRYPTGEFGILRQTQNGNGAETSEQVAYVVNVSSFGLGVQLDHPITVGAHVTLFVTECSFAGTVVYCREDGEAFAAGIALSCDTDQTSRLLTEVSRHKTARVF